MNMITPLSATIEITSKCNLECKYCFAESGGRKCNELALDSVKAIIDGLASLGNSHFLIMGGEPTLHRDFFKIVDYVKRKDLHVGFSTNGLRLTDSFCHELASYGINYNVYVSLDTIDPLSYKCITGRDKFTTVVTGMQSLKNNGIEFALSCVVIQQNIGILDEIYQFAYRHGASFLNLIRFNVEGRGVKNMNEMGIKLSTFNAICDELISKYGGFRGFWGENCIIPTNESMKSHLSFPKEEDLRQFLTIRSDGDVLLGRASGGLKIGNVLQDNIIDIWNGDIAGQYFSMQSNVFNELILNNVRNHNIGLL